MKKSIWSLSFSFEKLTRAVRNYRYMVIICFLIITAFLGAGMNKIVMDNSLDSFFRDNDPVKKEYDKFKTVFGGDEYIYIVYKARDGDIFSDKSLSALKELYDDIANYRIRLNPSERSGLGHIVEIKSLINIKFLEASEDTLFSRSFIGENLPENHIDRETLRMKALGHPDYPHLFLSEDSLYGGILLRTDYNSEPETLQDEKEVSGQAFDSDMDFDEEFSISSAESSLAEEIAFKKTDMAEYPILISTLKSLMEKKQYSDALIFHPVGKPVMMDFFATIVFKDLGRIIGIVFIIITVMLWLLFRSLSAVLWPVVLIFSSIIWTTGIIGWSGVHMSIMFQIIVFLVLSVGVADAVHIMSGYMFFRSQKIEHEKALYKVMEKSGFACFLTSITTAVGLFSLAVVPIRPISVFGFFSGVGVLSAFILTVFLMPIMLDLWNPVSGKKERKTHYLQRLIRLTEKTGPGKPRTVIIIFAALGILFLTGISNLRIDSDELEVLKDGLPLKDSFHIVDSHMAGTGNMEVSMDFKIENALKDPEVLVQIEKLQVFLQEARDTKVVKTQSLVNIVKDSYKALNNGNNDFYKIPMDPEILSQTLMLFENANPMDRRRLVTDDYSRARIGINSKNAGSVESLAFKKKVQRYIDDNFKRLKNRYPGCEISLTGNMALQAVMLDYISWSQIGSFGLTIIVISIILLIVFRDIKAGLIAIIPNIYPILATFGIMGFLDIPLDMDTLLIAPVIIGLAVDDTIHFMTNYRLEMQRCRDIKKAAINSVREAGQAICFTSITLGAGFSMFYLSFHKGLSHFGIFSAIAIFTAFIADIYLLPALCTFFHIDFSSKKTARDHEAEKISPDTVFKHHDPDQAA